MADDGIPGSGAFAVVCDIAASWEGYSETVGVAAPGLILHAAGPTDDGVRTIDVWESELAWDRHRHACTQPSPSTDLVQAPVLRELHVRQLVHPAPAGDDVRASTENASEPAPMSLGAAAASVGLTARSSGRKATP